MYDDEMCMMVLAMTVVVVVCLSVFSITICNPFFKFIFILGFGVIF